jgi:hypothetical protein
VKTQIWIAVSVYVLAAIVQKRLKLDVSLYTLMQVFSVTVFEKASIESVIFQTTDGSAYGAGNRGTSVGTQVRVFRTPAVKSVAGSEYWCGSNQAGRSRALT